MSNYIENLPTIENGYSPCCGVRGKQASSILAFCSSCTHAYFFRSFSVSGNGLFGKKHFDSQADMSEVDKPTSKIRKF